MEKKHGALLFFVARHRDPAGPGKIDDPFCWRAFAPRFIQKPVERGDETCERGRSVGQQNNLVAVEVAARRGLEESGKLLRIAPSGIGSDKSAVLILADADDDGPHGGRCGDRGHALFRLADSQKRKGKEGKQNIFHAEIHSTFKKGNQPIIRMIT